MVIETSSPQNDGEGHSRSEIEIFLLQDRKILEDEQAEEAEPEPSQDSGMTVDDFIRWGCKCTG
jgi:hypothetical protein